MSIFNMVRPMGAPRFCMDENATGGETFVPDAPAIIVREAPKDTAASLSITQAAKTLAGVRRQKPTEPAQSSDATATTDNKDSATAASADDTATADATKSEPKGDDAAPDKNQATGETQEKAPAADKEPSRPLPRSWTKEQSDYWNKLDPATQEFLVEQDRKASEAVRRSQNEAAEKTKALTAKEQAAEQARTTYENQVKAAVKILEREQLREFPDIRTVEDVRNLAQTDPLRYNLWRAHQDELAWAKAEETKATNAATNARNNKRVSYRDEQTAKLKELVPDFADVKKFTEVRERAVPLLEEYGFSIEQMNKWAADDAGFEILQHAGFAKLLADVLAFRDAEATRSKADADRKADEAKKAEALKKKVVPADVPPVQRPGSTQPTGGPSQHLQTLTKNLNTSGDLKDAVALLRARRAASARRAS